MNLPPAPKYMCPSFDELFIALKKLNPDKEIKRSGSKDYPEILSSAPANGLILPEGFDASSKGDITNKYNTHSGGYISQRIFQLDGSSYKR